MFTSQKQTAGSNAVRRWAALLRCSAVMLCVVLSSAQASPQMQKAAKDFWEVWKAKYLRPAGEHQLYVACEINGASSNGQSLSEGHGYGMLATVLLAEVDPQAQRTFDALLRFRNAHPSSADPHLMAWRQTRSDKERKTGDQETATDGDLDMAYALLLAERQWGGNGSYLKEAINMANAILRCEYNPELKLLSLGSWCKPGEPQWAGWRSSDFMPGHFKALAAATGDVRWSQLTDNGYELLRTVVAQHSPSTGLVPDFIDALERRPAPPRFLENKADGSFYYNACRVPWRLAVDYLCSGDRRALELLRPINAWAQRVTGGNPKKFNAGYTLDGHPLRKDWSMAFIGPMAVAATTQPEDRKWGQALGQVLLERSAQEEDYYGNTIKLMSLIVLGGFWR